MIYGESSGMTITTAEKNMVLRAHINLGHPPVKEFVRLLKAAGTRNDIINYVLREFHCEGCLKERRQPTRLPAATPRTYDFNVVIGVDALFITGAIPQEEHPVLNITCVGALYSAFTMIHPTRRASGLVWATFLRSWLRAFGSPSFLIYDQGLEFQGEVVEGLESHGIQPILIDRDAPYQNGVTERRGGLFKEVYYRTRELFQPADVTEVQNMIHEVSWALQTMTNRSGYSPAQRVFGKQPSVSMDILTDSGEYTFPQTMDAAWERFEKIRQAARKALMEIDGRERLQRAVRARPRRAHEDLHFVEGKPVYVWKQGLEAVPAELLKAKERLRFHSEKLGFVDVEREGAPPDLLQPEGSEPAPDQPPDQHQAPVHRRVPGTPRGPLEGSKRSNPKTPQPQPKTPAHKHSKPPTAAPTTPAAPATTTALPSQPSSSKDHTLPLSIEQAIHVPASPEPEATQQHEQADKQHRSRPPAPHVRQTASQTAQQTASQTAQPATPQTATDTQPATATAAADRSAGEKRKADEFDELWTATIENNRGKSSTARPSLLPPDPNLPLRAWHRYDFAAKRYRGSNSQGPLWGDVVRRVAIDLDSRNIIQDKKIEPEMSIHSIHEKLPIGTENIETVLIYQQPPDHPDPGKEFDEQMFQNLKTTTAPANVPSEDGRLVKLGMKRSLEEPGTNERVANRSKIFGVWRADDVTEWGDKRNYPVIANHRDLQVFRKLAHSDCFYEMSFKMRDDTFSLNYLTKQSGKELDEKKLAVSEIKMFREAKKLETNNLVTSSAIEIVTDDAEVKKIRSTQSHRIMPSRFILTKKTGEIGEGWKAKARWILLGRKDPDALELERYAPTPSSTTVMMCFQIISSMKFHLYIMDVSSAFGQSDPHEREQGPLFASLPPSGIPDVPAHALVRVKTAVYGLVNAPAVWRKTVRRHLLELGYSESVFDPCLYYLKPTAEELEHLGELGVAGVVLLDVDDFCQGGNERREELMNQLRAKLKFGKWRDVYKNSAEYIGRTLKQLETFEIQVSVKRYIEEKLRPVTLAKDRVKDKTSPLSETETTWPRGVGGSLLWVGKEGRPDVGAACAMAMSWPKSGPTVDNILAANKTVAELKATADVVLRVIPIVPKNGIWMRVADASMANVENKSQGGYIIAFAEGTIMKGEKAKFSINCWRSHRLKRVVKATLGSEALAMDGALAEIEWVRALWHEVMNPASNVLDGSRLGDQQSVLVMRKPDDPEFAESIASIQVTDKDLGAHVTDAKALYDLLHRRSGNAGQDRRAQIDVAVICVSARTLQLKTFWVPGSAMIADPLTKRCGNSTLLRKTMGEATYALSRVANDGS